MNETTNALLERLRQFRTTRSGKGIWLGDGGHAPVNVDEIIAALDLFESARRAAMEEGYKLGFANSGEGWNGEHPGDDYTKDPYWTTLRNETIRRALAASDKP